MTHISQLEYKVPLTDNVDQKALQTELPVRAAVDAVHATMLKYGLAVAPEEKKEEKTKGLLSGLFKKKE